MLRKELDSETKVHTRTNTQRTYSLRQAWRQQQVYGVAVGRHVGLISETFCLKLPNVLAKLERALHFACCQPSSLIPSLGPGSNESGVPKGYLGPVSLSSYSSGQLFSLGQESSSQCILDASTLRTDASDGIGSCGQGVASKGPAPYQIPVTDCTSLTPGGTCVSAQESLPSPPWFCPFVTLSSPEPRSRGGWCDANWPG